MALTTRTVVIEKDQVYQELEGEFWANAIQRFDSLVVVRSKVLAVKTCTRIESLKGNRIPVWRTRGQPRGR